MGILALAADERVAQIEVSEDELSVRIRDGRTISVPLVWYPRLLQATTEQRNNWRIIGAGYGIHWPDLDEDLSTEGLLRGAPASSPNLDRDSIRMATEGQSRIGEIGDEKGVWDYSAEIEEASAKIVDLFSSLSTETNSLGEKINRHADNIEKITKSSLPRAHSRYRAVTSQAATDIYRYCKRVEELLPQIDHETKTLESGLSFIAAYSAINTTADEGAEAIAALRPTIDSFLSSFRLVQKSVTEFREIALEMREQNLSAEFNRAVKRLLSLIDGLHATFEGIESSGLRFMFKMTENFKSEPNESTEDQSG